jgi:hypothetical protein
LTNVCGELLDLVERTPRHTDRHHSRFTTTAYFDDQPGQRRDRSDRREPAARPDAPPAPTGAPEADTGTNDALDQFDQEMFTT